jgi:hypothetical protein
MFAHTLGQAQRGRMAPKWIALQQAEEDEAGAGEGGTGHRASGAGSCGELRGGEEGREGRREGGREGEREMAIEAGGGVGAVGGEVRGRGVCGETEEASGASSSLLEDFVDNLGPE